MITQYLQPFLVGLVVLSCVGKGNAVTISSDISYAQIPGVDPNLLSLDVYAPDDADGSNPVMLAVHGGSYTAGDKTVQGWVHPKMEYYTDRGWVFISVNYRLTDFDLPADDANQVTHPEHIQDVVSSIAWTKQNIGSFGGSTDHLVLIGFSAGAHLVALAGTDDNRLDEQGLSLSDIDGVIALDGLYDIPLRNTQFPPPPTNNVLIWGSDSATQLDMSATTHVEPGKDIPPMLVIHQDLPNQAEQSNGFVNLLNANGYQASVHNAVGLTHPEIGQSVGVEGHELTLLVDDFLAGIVIPEPSSFCLLAVAFALSGQVRGRRR